MAVVVKQQLRVTSLRSFRKVLKQLKGSVMRLNDRETSRAYFHAVRDLGCGAAALINMYTTGRQEKALSTLTSLVDFIHIDVLFESLTEAMRVNSVSRFLFSIRAISRRTTVVAAGAVINTTREALEAVILPKILEEYLIDSAKREQLNSTNPTVFSRVGIPHGVAVVLSSMSLQSIILPKLVLLLKRTEKNIDTIVDVLSGLTCKQIDTSDYAKEIILIHLKPCYGMLHPGSTSESLAVIAAQLVLARVRSIQVKEEIVEGLNALVSSCYDERKRF